MIECTTLTFEEIKELIKVAGFWLFLTAIALSGITISKSR